VEHLRAREDDELRRLRREGVILVCGPVLAELLKGTPPQRRDSLWASVGSLPWAELDRAGWRLVGEAAAELRGARIPMTDVEIAVAAVRAEAALWTRDRDFGRVGGVLPALQLYRPGSA
jgi:predicted nucleic acid-binding protein